MNTFSSIGPNTELATKLTVPMSVAIAQSSSTGYPDIKEDDVELEFDQLQPKNADITLEQYAFTDVPLFEQDTVKYVAKELFARKKTVVITMALLVVFVLFIILVFTDVVSIKIGLPIAAIAFTAIVGIFWFHIIPYIILLRSVRRGDMRSVYQKNTK